MSAKTTVNTVVSSPQSWNDDRRWGRTCTIVERQLAMTNVEKQLEILAVERSMLADDLSDLVEVRLTDIAQRFDVCDVLSDHLSREMNQRAFLYDV